METPKLMGIRFSSEEVSEESLRKSSLHNVYPEECTGIKKKYTLGDLSNPPTDEELSNYIDVPPSMLPPKYKRGIHTRVFVNRDIRLDRMKFFGFDMDYTLAVYNSPDFEQLAYGMILERLVKMGYPKSILQLKYDPSFPTRGLFLDREYGNLLKVDGFGNIKVCVHGRKNLSTRQTSTLYPSMVVHNEMIGKRFYLLNTLFTLPEACLYGDLVEHLEGLENITLGEEVAQEQEFDDQPSVPAETSLPKSDLSYTNLFQDIRIITDLVHAEGILKSKVLADLPRYIKKTPDLAVFLDRLRQTGNKTFLLTNSEYYYTEKVMSYLLNEQNPKYLSWTSYFDVVMVNAEKPRFFGEGSTIREVDTTTGHLKITHIGDHFEQGKVYSGGSLSLFHKLTGAKGNEVLYIGDHIFADIIKSKKVHGWRNLLVVPELTHELTVWGKNQDKYNHLLNLEFIKAEIFRGLDSNSIQPPDISVLRRHIKETVKEVNREYNIHFGSLFRSGSKFSFFAMQVQRYADLYTSDYLNLLNYPLFYEFTANVSAQPHEYKPNEQ
jgi:5'-nucleotidase